MTKLLPRLPLNWIEFEVGQMGVFAIARGDLVEHAKSIKAVLKEALVIKLFVIPRESGVFNRRMAGHPVSRMSESRVIDWIPASRRRMTGNKDRGRNVSSNSFGKVFTVTTFGESHGPAIGCVSTAVRRGWRSRAEEFRRDLDRRATGKSRYTSQRHEADDVEILSGVFEGRTTGTPIAC